MKTLTATTLRGERVVAVFPCIGGNDHDTEVDAVVLTTDDALRPTFTATRVFACHDDLFVLDTFTTLPAALRFARQQLGWG